MVTFYILDVFAPKKYSGNQLAVVPNAGKLSDMQMQEIAKEINYSETTFILSDEKSKGGYNVRIFTPEEEVPFAGHPTLGTAYIIVKEIIGNKVEKIVLNLKIGQITVKFNWNDYENPVLWMKQNPPVFGHIFKPESISKVLKINVDDIDDRFPVQEVSTGLPFILVPLKDLNAVKRAEISLDRYYTLIKDRKAKAILVFCLQTYHEDNDLNVRMFAPHYGIPEDPATGSANGCLAGYLVKYHYFNNNKIDVKVEQGYEIGRPSLILLKAKSIPEKKGYEEVIEVFVGGNVFMVAKGNFL